MDYIPRLMDDYLDYLLKCSGAIVIQGPKWSGKTTTALRKAGSTLMLGDTAVYNNAVRIAGVNPRELLSGNVPRLIDEWQLIPSVWDSIRTEVDSRGEKGQFILTGSATSVAKTLHSGTGRILRVNMRPMSLYESGDSDGSVSLSDLFDGKEISGSSDMDLRDAAYLIIRGGWPETIGYDERMVATVMSGYIDSIADLEISTCDGVRRDADNVRKLIESLSRNIATTASLKTIRLDVEKHQTMISEKTISDYISALRRIFIVENLPAWSTELRSKATIRKSPKRFFVDPSIAAVSLRSSSERMMDDMSTMGLLFENLCIRDIRVYAQMLDGKVYYYQDNNGLEVDAVIQLWDGRWGAIEVKMGVTSVDDGARNLLRLANIVVTPPSFLAVVTMTGYAYRREDGVYVVPIGCLRNRGRRCDVDWGHPVAVPDDPSETTETCSGMNNTVTH